MELYCEHHGSSFNDDDTFLLDDENTNERRCLKCRNKNQIRKDDDFNTVIQIEGNSWIQNKNGIITGMSHNERLCTNSDNLESPEDSPLLTSVCIKI